MATSGGSFFQGESDDEQFVASFALQSMGRFASEHRSNLSWEKRTTTWCLSVVVNRVHGQQVIEIKGQPPRLVGENPCKGLEALQQTKGKDATDNALLDGRESQNRRATIACISLFCTDLGQGTIFLVS